MSKLSFTFNGFNFEDYIDIDSSFSMPVGPNKTDKTVKAGVQNGTRFVSTTDDLTEIEMPIIISGVNFKHDFNILKEKLRTDKPEKLIISDYPDRYWLARPKIASAPKRDSEIYLSMTITWQCYFPYSQSLDPISVQSDTTGLIKIKNNAPLSAPVDFSITNHGDNGYFGISGTESVIQIGNPQEIDGTNTVEQRLALFNTFNDDSELSSWEMNTYQPAYAYGNTLGGTFATHSGLHGDHSVYVSDFKSGDIKTMWYGASMYKGFSTIGTNFDLSTLIQTVRNGNQSLGVSEFNVYDIDGKVLCGYRFRQINSGGEMQLFFYVRDKIVKEWTTNASAFLKNFWGNINITKEGSDFTFRVINLDNDIKGTYHYYDNSLADIAGVGAGFWAAKYQGFDAFKCELFMVSVKVSETGFDNLKNVFSEGDDIKINSTDAAVVTLLNGNPRIDLQDFGTSPIFVPPGESSIQVSKSSFAGVPEVTATYRERWL